MHEYRRFVQQQLDERAWKPAELARKSGLSRQLIWSILNDGRQHLGQMPDESTLAGLSKGFNVPVELLRTAAARSLIGYADDGTALTVRLQDVSTDALLNEVRRRIDANESRTADPAAEPHAQAQGDEGQEAKGLFDDPKPSPTAAAFVAEAGRVIDSLGGGAVSGDGVERTNQGHQ